MLCCLEHNGTASQYKILYFLAYILAYLKLIFELLISFCLCITDKQLPIILIFILSHFNFMHAFLIAEYWFYLSLSYMFCLLTRVFKLVKLISIALTLTLFHCPLWSSFYMFLRLYVVYTKSISTNNTLFS